MRHTFCLILVGVAYFTGFAQTMNTFSETNDAKESLRHAQEFINNGRYKTAKKQLRHTIKIKEDFAVAHLELGRVLSELHEYEAATEAFENSFDLDNKLSRAAFFECGEAWFKLGEVEKADYYYQKYQDGKGTNYANKKKESGLELTYDERLAERLLNCEYISRLDTSWQHARPFLLEKNINTKHDEYLPTITSDGSQLVFTRQKQAGDEDIMTSEWKNDKWSKSRSFGSAINTGQNEGMAKFETHGRAFYFAGCMRSDTEGGCDIYKAVMNKGKVSEVQRVDGQLNSSDWDSQPSITCDGQLMFFSSSRDGGQGGADIWMSRLQADGEWGYPENLGPYINSPGDEEAPFISSDGQTLYFSSNGHPGQGDGDLFLARRQGGVWSLPQNLGYPINSPAKELGFYVQGDGQTAYFASARPGGAGGLDIYRIALPTNLRPDPMVHLEGFVKNGDTGEGVSTTISIGREAEKWQVKSDDDGWFFVCLPGDRGYSFQINQKGYQYLIEAEFLPAQDNAAPVQKELLLMPVAKPQFTTKPVEIKEKRIQFFFDFDSYQLNQNAVRELDKLTDFLKKETDWKVEVVGYADSKGDVDYNKILSEKRAGVIVDYLKNEGINIENVVRKEGRGSVKSKDADDTQFRRVDVILRRN